MQHAVEGMARRACLKAFGLKHEVWFWGEAIAFDAGVLVADLTDDACLRAAAEEILGTWARELLSRPVRRTDVYAPLRAVLSVHRKGGGAELLDAAVKVADYIIEAPADAGAHLHKMPRYPPMVFVDFIYYVGPYLGEVAALTGDTRYLDAAVDQTLAHLAALQDPSTGLVDHVYDPNRRETNGVAWGRGNGWALLGLVDTLSIVPAAHPKRQRINEGFRIMLDSCVALQDASGMWRTILDDPNSPLENSIAAFFFAAFAKATRSGLIDRDLASVTSRAWSSVLGAIDDDGGFPISMTEWPDWNPRAYYDRPIGINAWGQGCFVRAVAEYLIDHQVPGAAIHRY